NHAGVIPIIFAISILLFPTQIAQYFTTSTVAVVRDVANGVVSFFANQVVYAALYFLLTMGFTYFYTAFTFKPDETADQLRKNGGFITAHPARAPHARLPPERRLSHHAGGRDLPGHGGRDAGRARDLLSRAWRPIHRRHRGPHRGRRGRRDHET